MLCVNFRTVGPVTLQKKMFEYLFSSVDGAGLRSAIGRAPDS